MFQNQALNGFRSQRIRSFQEQPMRKRFWKPASVEDISSSEQVRMEDRVNLTNRVWSDTWMLLKGLHIDAWNSLFDWLNKLWGECHSQSETEFVSCIFNPTLVRLRKDQIRDQKIQMRPLSISRARIEFELLDLNLPLNWVYDELDDRDRESGLIWSCENNYVLSLKR